SHKNMAKKYGTPIRLLIEEGSNVAENALLHGVASENYTLGQAAHEDVGYGQSDPRAEAGYKSLGDATARGGTGPDKKG
ncbi:MAG: hypothetical protein AAB954_02725, partial [Patescibacteria group bacterium]